MADVVEWDHHYHLTPRETEGSEIECWRDLAKYMKEHIRGRPVWFRELPAVESDRDFNTKITRWRGVVRFHVAPAVLFED